MSSFKCGPDYIDPMFHTKVIGTKSTNLDTFFTDLETTRYLFARAAEGTAISVMEGVMGYYDGLGGISTKASAADLAEVTETPVLLIVNARGMSLSALAVIKGFLTYQEPTRIKGIILNQISEMMYGELADLIEKELGISVYGYVPKVPELTLESRHLGLVLPEEVAGLTEKLDGLAAVLEKTLDLDGILELAETAEPIIKDEPEALCQIKREAKLIQEKQPVVAVASDEAFCFIYEDNLRILKELGAKLHFFSPIHDEKLPEDAAGLLLYGGYPELFATPLGDNISMKESIYKAIMAGVPTMAECGGFMYLHEEMEDMEGQSIPMAGVIRGRAYRTKRLGRFGYISLTAQETGILGSKNKKAIKGHEFHYFDSTSCGESFLAQKPLRKRNWSCIHGKENALMGFPHLYYYSNPSLALDFLQECVKFGGARA